MITTPRLFFLRGCNGRSEVPICWGSGHCQGSLSNGPSNLTAVLKFTHAVPEAEPIGQREFYSLYHNYGLIGDGPRIDEREAIVCLQIL